VTTINDDASQSISQALPTPTMMRGIRRSLQAQPGKLHRRFFDKIMLQNGTLNNQQDGQRFLAACLEFSDDPLDLLYRLTSPKAS